MQVPARLVASDQWGPVAVVRLTAMRIFLDRDELRLQAAAAAHRCGLVSTALGGERGAGDGRLALVLAHAAAKWG